MYKHFYIWLIWKPLNFIMCRKISCLDDRLSLYKSWFQVMVPSITKWIDIRTYASNHYIIFDFNISIITYIDFSMCQIFIQHISVVMLLFCKFRLLRLDLITQSFVMVDTTFAIILFVTMNIFWYNWIINRIYKQFNSNMNSI